MSKIVYFLILLFLILSGCTYQNKLTQTKELMGTIVSITVIDKDLIKANKSIELAFNEIERINALMSHYDTKSQVSMLNNKGYLNDADNELIYVLRKAEYYSNLSNGAFDITVQPILDLYSKSVKEQGKLPSDAEIKEILDLINYQNILMDENNVWFRKKGMKITLGGIAKGYAVDQAIESLKENKINHALVNAGGDIRAIGNKGKEPWSIALQNPRNKEDYITIIKLENNAVATSGDYERYFIDKEHHHIIDPQTGKSAEGLISVTIIADKAIDADALATAVFVLGKEDGFNLIESLENVEALLITKDKGIVKSTGFN